MLKDKIIAIKNEALEAISGVESIGLLDELKIKYLGRKSEFGMLMRELKNVSHEERKEVGQLANVAKKEIEDAFAQAENSLKQSSFDFAAEKIDVSMPAHKKHRGHLHPLTKIQNEIEDIFTSMGFEIADGPEVETEFYNFDALNIPKDHPARDMQDTFWVNSKLQISNSKTKGDGILLRTHTSNVQTRYMETHTPPFRIIAPGRIFRNESTDATHEHTFHQFEALVVGSRRTRQASFLERAKTRWAGRQGRDDS